MESQTMTSAIPSADQVDPGLHDDLDVDSGISAIVGRSQSLMGSAQSRLLDLAEDGKTELARGFDGLIALANELAARVDSAGVGPFAGYAWQAAGVLKDIQQGLRDRPVEDLLDDGRALIRREPALAVGVAVAAGFIAARLFKSSSR
jgi:hypothetical protein